MLEDEDVLDYLDSNSVEEVSKLKDEQPKQYNQSSGKSNNRFGNKGNDLYDNPNIQGVKANIDELKSTSYEFAFFNYKRDIDAIPTEVSKRIIESAEALVDAGFSYRHNGAVGKTITKIIGLDYTKVASYIPWKKGFESSPNVKLSKIKECGYKHAAYYHKGFSKLGSPLRAILGRDIHVILGDTCKDPIRVLLVYSEDGAESHSKINFKTTENASFPISVASQLNIPVFNANDVKVVDRVKDYIKTIKK